MKVEMDTTRFGRIKVDPENILLFPQGLIGFEHLKRYTLVDSKKGASLQWLQSLDDPAIAFLVCNPKTFLPLLDLTLPEPGSSPPQVNHVDVERVIILTILYVDREKGLVRINVQAPLLLDPASGKGVQVITDAQEPTVSIPLKSA